MQHGAKWVFQCFPAKQTTAGQSITPAANSQSPLQDIARSFCLASMFLTTKSVPAWEDKLDTTRSTKLVADISLMMIAWGALWCLQSSTTRARLHVSTDLAKSQDSEAIWQTMQVVIKPRWYGPGPRDVQDEMRINPVYNPVYPESTHARRPIGSIGPGPQTVHKEGEPKPTDGHEAPRNRSCRCHSCHRCCNMLQDIRS